MLSTYVSAHALGEIFDAPTDVILALGVPHYWLVEPDERYVETYVIGKRRYRRSCPAVRDSNLCSEPFPDLVIGLAKVWG